MFPGNDSHICLPPALPTFQIFIQKGPSASRLPRSEVSEEGRAASQACSLWATVLSLQPTASQPGLPERFLTLPSHLPILTYCLAWSWFLGLSGLPAPMHKMHKTELGDPWPSAMTPRGSCFPRYRLLNWMPPLWLQGMHRADSTRRGAAGALLDRGWGWGVPESQVDNAGAVLLTGSAEPGTSGAGAHPLLAFLPDSRPTWLGGN